MLRTGSFPACLAAGLALLSGALLAPVATAQPLNTYRFATTLGNIDVTMRSDLSPRTVANFLAYTGSGAYNASIIHRSVPGFVIQGGGYTLNSGYVYTIATNAPVAGEFSLPNTRGTIAMALSTGPNSATSEWFFNLQNNSSLLDGTGDGGPFTAFGQVCNSASLAVMDAIGGTTVVDASNLLGPAFSQLPVVNFTPGVLAASNFVLVNSITLLSSSNGPDTYSAGSLSIPSLVIGSAIYSNLVVGVGHIASGPGGSTPNTCGDTYNTASGELTVPTVVTGGTKYYNVVAAVGGPVTIGSVTGADTYDGTRLSIALVQVAGGTIHHNAVITVASVLGIAGGMPTATQDQYNPVSRQLFIPAVQYGSKVYTNVTVTVGSVISAGK